tara:strand:- start:6641 stop:7165 length:525 start_codon:yes stop_codon:yes gene_type:complete
MKTEALERYLNSFGKQVVNRAKGNLQKSKGGGTNLEKSLSFKVVTSEEGFSVQFLMDSYGTFVDKGVSGTDVRRSFKDYKGKTISSPYKYTTKQPPSRVLDKWIVKKGIAPRDEKGRFMSRKSISFLIARSIKRKGIQGISFFQKPLMLGLKQFGKEMLGAVKDDIINGLTTVK